MQPTTLPFHVAFPCFSSALACAAPIVRPCRPSAPPRPLWSLQAHLHLSSPPRHFSSQLLYQRPLALESAPSSPRFAPLHHAPRTCPPPIPLTSSKSHCLAPTAARHGLPRRTRGKQLRRPSRTCMPPIHPNPSTRPTDTTSTHMRPATTRRKLDARSSTQTLPAHNRGPSTTITASTATTSARSQPTA